MLTNSESLFGLTDYPRIMLLEYTGLFIAIGGFEFPLILGGPIPP